MGEPLRAIASSSRSAKWVDMVRQTRSTSDDPQAAGGSVLWFRWFFSQAFEQSFKIDARVAQRRDERSAVFFDQRQKQHAGRYVCLTQGPRHDDGLVHDPL